MRKKHPGATGLVSGDHIHRVAKPDGLTMAYFIGGLFLQQLLGRPGLDVDATEFAYYVGMLMQDDFGIGFSAVIDRLKEILK